MKCIESEFGEQLSSMSYGQNFINLFLLSQDQASINKFRGQTHALTFFDYCQAPNLSHSARINF